MDSGAGNKKTPLIPAPESKVWNKFHFNRYIKRSMLGNVIAQANDSLGYQVAVKVINNNPDTLEERLTELEFLKRSDLQDMNFFLKFIDCDLTAVNTVLVTEYSTAGDLRKAFKCGIQPVDPVLSSFILSNILVALSCLASHSIIHGDIKPENLFVFGDKENPIIKIGDFGLARLAPQPGADVSPSDTRGTPGYMAPELLFCEHYNDKVDVFAAGVVAYTLVSGFEPFYPSSEFTSCHFNWNVWNGNASSLRGSIASLLKLDRSSRPSACEAVIDVETSRTRLKNLLSASSVDYL